jgi:hypothetical protein
MRVIAPEPNNRYNFTKAEAYGQVVFLMEEAQNPFQDGLLATYKKRFSELNFDPEQDVLCMTGQSLITAMMLATVLREHGRVKILMFDARVSDYRLKALEAA